MIFTPTYTPPVSYAALLIAFAKQGVVYGEACEYYRKQTLRNRCFIAGANGIEMLSIPVQKGADRQCPMKDVRISLHGNWVHQHRNAIQSAYGSAPYYEFYADDILSLYDDLPDTLMAFNLIFLQKLLSLLDYSSFRIEETDRYEIDPLQDFRLEEISQGETSDGIPFFSSQSISPYYQPFALKNGFIGELSLLDLIFNLGPESRMVLQSRANSLLSLTANF